MKCSGRARVPVGHLLQRDGRGSEAGNRMEPPRIGEDPIRDEAEEKPGSSRIESRLGRTNRNLHERSCSSDARSLANRHVSARADLYPSQSIVR